MYDSLPPLFLLFYLFCVPSINVASIYIRSYHSIYSVILATAILINPFNSELKHNLLVPITGLYLCVSFITHLFTANLVFLINPIYVVNYLTSLLTNLMYFVVTPLPYFLCSASISGKILECVQKIDAATDHKTKMAYAWLSITCTLSIITIALGNLTFLPFQVIPPIQSSQIARTFSKIVAGSGLVLYCKCRKKMMMNSIRASLKKQIQLI